MNRFLSVFLMLLGAGACPILLAQAHNPPETTKKKATNAKTGTDFDFEGTTVKGERTSPMGSILEQATPDQSYDFITIRGNWRKELVKSADSLDTQVSSLNFEND